MNTENNFEINGVRYIAVPSEWTCKGCAFEHVPECLMLIDFSCEKELREDGQNVIFKRATDCRLETENKDKNEA